MQPLSTVEKYEKQKVAVMFTVNNDNSITSSTGTSNLWDYEKVHGEKGGLKRNVYFNKSAEQNGKKFAATIKATTIKKKIENKGDDKSRRNLPIVFLSKVPRAFYSRENLALAFNGIYNFLSAASANGSLTGGYAYYSSAIAGRNVDAAVDTQYYNNNADTLSQDIADTVYNTMRSDGHDNFVNDNGYVQVRLAGDDVPELEQNNYGPLFNLVRNTSSNPLVHLMIRSGLAGGEATASSLGQLYKIWLAVYILNTFGYSAKSLKNNPSFDEEIRNEAAAEISVKKDRKQSRWTIQQYISLSKKLRDGKTVPLLERNGKPIHNMRNYPIMEDRKQFTDLVIRHFKKYGKAVIGDDPKAVYYNVFAVTDGFKRIDVTEFPAVLNVDENIKLKDLSSAGALADYAQSRAFSFTNMDNKGVRSTYNLPAGFFVAGPERLANYKGNPIVAGGVPAFATVFYALGLENGDIIKVLGLAKLYEKDFNDIGKSTVSKRGKKAINLSLFDDSSNIYGQGNSFSNTQSTSTTSFQSPAGITSTSSNNTSSFNGGGSSYAM